MKLAKRFLALILSSFICSQSMAASAFFFPDIYPNFLPRETPEWLREGSGLDGYLTITSEVIPTSSCVPLSNKGFWGSQKTQLVISVVTNGFNTKLNNTEIPIATFDGRDNGSECASLSTTPMRIVPFALLGAFSSSNPGTLSLVLNVKTASNSSQDLLGPVQLMLGAAAMVATGGAAATIGGLTATVSNPVLSEAQKRTNTLLKDMVNGKTPITMSWPEVRNGIDYIEIPVYRAEGTLGSTPDKKIQQLQTDPKADKTKLFDVRFTFSYTKTLFDLSASGINDLPNPEGISTANVLNYPGTPGTQNFLQILNNTSPSLLQTMGEATGVDLKNACSIAFEKLKTAGLTHMDTAIVMKSFIDEAKRGADWYANPEIVNSCFGQSPNVQAYLVRIYGQSQPSFVIGDVQEGVGKEYNDWKTTVGPVLANFRQALIAKQDRLHVLATFNGGQDIEVTFTPEVTPWVAANDTNPDPNKKDLYPGLKKIITKNYKTSACFIYRDKAHLNPKTYGAYMILEDSDNNYWLAQVKLGSGGQAKVTKLRISAMNADWRNYFKSFKYPGGECSGVLSRMTGK